MPRQSERVRRDKKIIKMARVGNNVGKLDCEIDDTAIVSEGEENGAYVQAWLWVSFVKTEFDKEKDEK